MGVTAPTRLLPEYELDAFDCGNVDLNEWLHRRARTNEAQGASRTYVVCNGQQVVAYYCLAVGSVEQNVAVGRVKRNMPNPIPVMIIGRLAVDRSLHGQGFGRGLLKDAVLRTVAASEIAGIRAILVHAISDEAKAFYEKHGFRPSPVHPMTLMMTIQDATANCAASSG